LRQRERCRQVVRLQRQRLFERLARTRRVVGKNLLTGDGQLRFRPVHVVLQHVLQHVQTANPVRPAREQKLQREDRAAPIVRRHSREFAGENRLGVVRLAGQDEQRCIQLRGAFRIRRILLPQLRSGQRVRRALRSQRDFGRALRHTRVVRVAREGEVGLIGGRRLVALQRDFGGEHLEYDLTR
jgi:hypothetical protein